MIRKILASKRADGGYLDVVIGVMAVVMCLVVALSIFTVIFQKNTMDRIADDLIEAAAYSGEFGEEFEKKLASIQEKYGDAYTVEINVGEAGWYNAERKQVQLGDEMIIVVRRNSELRRFDIANLAVNLSTTRVAVSEKYWKTDEVDYDSDDPDAPVTPSDYTYVINTANNVFHQRNCTLIGSIPSLYRQNTSKSYERLIAEGYVPCGTCNPHNCFADEIEAFNATSHWGTCATCGGDSDKAAHELFNDGGVYKCVKCNYVQEYGETYCRYCHVTVTNDVTHYMDCRGYAVVTYHSNGGAFYPDNNTTNTVTIFVDSGTAVYGTLKTPINGNAVFVGWYLDREGLTEFDHSTASGSVDVYASWGYTRELLIDEEKKYWPEIGYVDGQDVALEIPATLQHDGVWYEVTGIADDAFANDTNLISINIPDSVKEIGTGAFYGCSGLKTVRLPSGLKRIHNDVFRSCSALTSINIPDSVTFIDEYAFYGCTSLATVNLPEGVTTIEQEAFAACTQLNNLIIPASVTKIGANAFRTCNSLNAIAFRHQDGDAITIGTNAFYAPQFIATSLSTRNRSILQYNWEKDNRIFVCEDMTITQANRHWIGFTDTTTELTIPEYTFNDDGVMYRITGIGESAFANSDALISLVVPSNVGTIERNAFLGCSNLVNITFEHAKGDELTIKEDAFQVAELVQTDLVASHDVPLTYDWAADNRKLQYKELIVTEETRKWVGYTEGADFAQDLNIPSVVSITESGQTTMYQVVAIGANAFEGTNLGSVVVPGTVTRIDDAAFCDSTITSLSVEGNALTEIGGSAFENCTKLSEVFLPDSVTTIGPSAFQNCSGLLGMKLPSGLKKLSASVFQECTSMADMVIPDGVTSIEADAFYGCYKLETVIIPSSVTNIAAYAFDDCTSLTHIIFGESGKAYNSSLKIGAGAFRLAPEDALETTVTTRGTGDIPAAITGYNWTNDNRTLTAVDYFAKEADKEFFRELNASGETGGTSTWLVLPEYFWRDGINYRLIGIEESAFAGEDYQKITLPNSIGSIGDGAFGECSNLTSVEFPSGNVVYGEYIFENCGFTSITLPTGWTSVPVGMFAGCTNLTAVVYPSTITTIEECAFYESGLRNIVIPGHIREIGEAAFASIANNTTTATTLALNEGLVIIGDRAFSSSEIASVELPSTVTSIGADAFAGNTISTIVIPASVSELGDRAFGYCGSLTNISFGHAAGDAIHLGKNVFVVSNSTQTQVSTQKNEIWNYNWEGDKRLLNSKTILIDNVSRAWIGYTNATTELNIPENFGYMGERYTVIGIAADAFSDCGKLKSVTLPDTVTEIGANAFYGCSGLTEIELPAGLTALGQSAFEGCTGLKSIKIPAGVTRLEDYAFSDTGSLESAELPEGLEYIGKGAFSGSALTEIVIPSTVTQIGDGAFTGNSMATSITFTGTSLKVIGDNAFSSCTRITEIKIPGSVTEIGDKAFAYNNRLTKIAFLHTGKASAVMGENVFITTDSYNSTKLLITSLTAPNFAWQYDWTGDNRYLDLKTETVTVDNRSWTAGYTSGATEITIPETVINGNGEMVRIIGIDEEAFKDCTTLKKVTMPSSISYIAASAFENCSLTEIALPSALTYIGDAAFKGNNLTVVTVPGSVTDFGVEVFADNATLKSVVIESGVTTISRGMFQGCTALETVAIGSQVTAIGESAFENCNLNGSVTIPASVSTIGNKAFYGNDLLTSIIFAHTDDDEVTLGTNVFWVSGITATNVATRLDTVINYDWAGDNRIVQANEFTITAANRGDIGYTASTTVLEIPATFVKDGKLYTVVGIDNAAFEGCTQLQTVIMPDTITKMGIGAFRGCTGLRTVALSSNIARIEDCAFEQCTALTSIVLPDGLTLINVEAFYGCTALTEITIPASVTVVEDMAFYGCTNLTTIRFEHTNENRIAIGSEAFYVPELLGTTFVINNNAVRDYNWAGDNRHDASVVVELTITQDNRNWAEIGFTDEATSLSIPATFTRNRVQYKVVAIGEGAFESTKLQSVTIPSGVTRIGNYAFCGGRLKNVTLPSSLTEIGEYAFSDNLLTSVTLPNSITSLGASAFETNSLQSITIPTGLTEVADFAFAYNSLTSVTLHQGITHIGWGAFDNNKITSLILPKNLVSIDKFAFSNNQGLTTVTIPASVTQLGDNAFADCDGLTTIVFEHTNGDSLTFGNKVFYVSSTVDTTVKAQLHEVYDYAWSGDNRKLAVEDVVIDASNRHWVGYTSTATSINFNYCIDDNGMLRRVVGIGDNAFANCTKIVSIELPDSCTSIGNSAFSGCTNLATVDHGGTITTIGNYAFDGCTALADADTLVEGAALKTIGNYAFRNCKKLTAMTVGANVTSIGQGAFYGCANLTQITVNHGKNTSLAIGKNAFYVTTTTATVLTNVNENIYVEAHDWEGDNRDLGWTDIEIYVGNRAWIGYTDSTTALNIPEKFLYGGNRFRVIGIGEEAFMDCSNLRTVTLPDTVTYIKKSAFQGSGLAEIILPDSVQEIGEQVFEACENLTAINIPEGVTKLGWGVFCDTSLTSIDLPESLQTIDGYAFQNTQLQSITFPSSVTYIGSNAFNGTNLSSVTIPAAGSALQIGPNAFSENPNLTSITLPARVSSVGQYAFYRCNNLTNITFEHVTEPITITNGAFMCSKVVSTNLSAKKEAIWSYNWTADNRNVVVKNVDITADIAEYLGYDPSDDTLTIPASYINADGVKCNVVGIGAYAFCETEASTIVLPATVKTIGAYAFRDAYRIDSINLDNVTQIGEGAFENSGLTDLALPSGITRIEANTFANCSMTDVVIPKNINYIGGNAFGNCDILTTIEFGHDADDALTIAADAFGASVYVATDVTSVHDAAWNYDWEASLRLLVAEEFEIDADNWSDVASTPNATTLVIPASFVSDAGRLHNVTSIAPYAFTGNSVFQTVTLPEGLRSIGGNAFAESYVKTINFPSTLQTIGQSAFECASLQSVDLSKTSITEISAWAFYDITEGLKNVVLPDGLKEIGNGAFGNAEISKIVIPASVTNIGKEAFSDCLNLTSIEFEHGTNAAIAFGTNVFETDDATVTALTTDCKAVWDYDWVGDNRYVDTQEITISSDDTLAYTYNAATKTLTIKEVYVDANGTECIVVGIDNGGFIETEAQTIILPDTVTSIGSYAFQDAYRLDSINLENVTTIGAGAFDNATLGNVVLSDGLTRIENGTFNGSVMTSITIPSSVTYIGAYAFDWCYDLTNIVFEHSTGDTLTIATTAFTIDTETATTVKGVHTAVRNYDWEGEGRPVTFS